MDLLREIIIKADSEYSPTGRFGTIRLADVRSALKEFDEEEVRLAAFVPSLSMAGRLEEASQLNLIALQSLTRIVDAGGSDVVSGVSLHQLNENKAYLDLLIAAQARPTS